jgi:hypothetical protein
MRQWTALFVQTFTTPLRATSYLQTNKQQTNLSGITNSNAERYSLTSVTFLQITVLSDKTQNGAFSPVRIN